MKSLIWLIIMALPACSPEPFNGPNEVLKKELVDQNCPAVEYYVFNQDSILHSFRQGFANIKAHKAISAEASFNAYSTTKTFTALAILQLVQRGKVDLDAPVSAYLPDTPFSSEIKIKHLLAHSAGIADPIPLSWIHLAEEDGSFDEKAFFSALLEKNKKLKNKPGEKFKYSNLGYVLLGQVISSVSGMSYQQYITQNILSNLDLTPGALGFRIYDRQNHITGYHKHWSFTYLLLSFFIDKRKYMNPAEGVWKPFKPLYVNGAAYGGLIGTPEGMIKYLQEYLKPDSKLISPQIKQLLFTETLTPANKPTGMCFSWYTGQLNGSRYYTHAGGGGGFYLEMRVYPEQGVGSLIVFNRTGMSDERFLDNVDKFFIAES